MDLTFSMINEKIFIHDPQVALMKNQESYHFSFVSTKSVFMWLSHPSHLYYFLQTWKFVSVWSNLNSFAKYSKTPFLLYFLHIDSILIFCLCSNFLKLWQTFNWKLIKMLLSLLPFKADLTDDTIFPKILVFFLELVE